MFVVIRISSTNVGSGMIMRAMMHISRTARRISEIENSSLTLFRLIEKGAAIYNNSNRDYPLFNVFLVPTSGPR